MTNGKTNKAFLGVGWNAIYILKAITISLQILQIINLGQCDFVLCVFETFLTKCIILLLDNFVYCVALRSYLRQLNYIQLLKVFKFILTTLPLTVFVYLRIRICVFVFEFVYLCTCIFSNSNSIKHSSMKVSKLILTTCQLESKCD